MGKLYQLEGIVIRVQDHGEANKIITLYTKEQGKVSIYAKGAKKPKSRFIAQTQWFVHGEFHFYRASGMGNLQYAEIQEFYRPLRERMDLTAYAAYAAELLDKTTQEDEGSGFMYEQLQACFLGLIQNKDPQILLHFFEAKILGFGGYTPQLEACTSCQSDTSLSYFSVQLGGVLCERCKAHDIKAIFISPVTLRLLTLFFQLDMRKIGEIKIGPKIGKQLQNVMQQFLDTHLNVSLKSKQFLDLFPKDDTQL